MSKPSSSNEQNRAFQKALGKVISVPRNEMERRIAQAKPEKSSLHKRYKYVPAKEDAQG